MMQGRTRTLHVLPGYVAGYVLIGVENAVEGARRFDGPEHLQHWLSEFGAWFDVGRVVVHGSDQGQFGNVIRLVAGQLGVQVYEWRAVASASTKEGSESVDQTFRHGAPPKILVQVGPRGLWPENSGRGDRIRTCDPLLRRQGTGWCFSL